MPRTTALTAVRERWKAALPVGVIATYANWKPTESDPRPNPASGSWVEEVIAADFAEDAAVGRSTRWRRHTASVQLNIRTPRDGGVKPALDLADALERALLTGANITLADGTPVLVFDTAIQPVRDESEWFMIPFVLFFTYTVALTAA